MEIAPDGQAVNRFLYSQRMETQNAQNPNNQKMKQLMIRLVPIEELVAIQLAREIINDAVESAEVAREEVALANLVEVMENDKEWENEILEKAYESIRARAKEVSDILDEVDKASHEKQKKKEKALAKRTLLKQKLKMTKAEKLKIAAKSSRKITSFFTLDKT